MEKKFKKPHKKLIIIISIVLSILLIPNAIIIAYLSISYSPNEYALSCMKSDDKVNYYQKNNYFCFESKIETEKCVIFYPGARIKSESYAPLGYNLAKNGVNSVICSFPFNIALFNMNIASEIINAKPNLEYYLAGHSLGGAAASIYISKNINEKVKGLILLASYSNKDISKSNVKTLSILGSNDDVLNKDKYNKYRSYLPNLKEEIIEGGNHAQFGAYGAQKDDGIATISNQEQIEITAKLITTWINS